MRTKVLLIEDDEAIRESVEDVFAHERPDLECISVHNAEDAIAALERGVVPSLFLLDYMMPGGGAEALFDYKYAKAALRDIPVIFLSAARIPEKVTQRPCVRAVLQKPFRIDELLALLPIDS